MATVQARRLRESPPLRLPTEDEIKQAQEMTRLIESSPGRMTIQDEDGTESRVEIPPLARTILEYVLAEMAAGNGVMLSRLRPLLTPFEAASLLGVSPAYLTGLMDSGELPCHESGEIRRIGFEDLMAYKRKDDEATSKGLDEMVALSQELGLY
jgi:excisionase family DNA binding protein